MTEHHPSLARTWLLLCLLSFAGGLNAGTTIAEPTPENVRAALEAEPVEGVRIDTVTLSGDKDVRARLEGNSATNERLSAFMRRIETSEAFHQTELMMIQVDPAGGYRFELQCKVRRPPTPAVAPKESTPATSSPTQRKVFRCVIGGTETFQMKPCPAT